MKKLAFLVCLAIAMTSSVANYAQSTEMISGGWSADAYVNLRSEEIPFKLDLSDGKFVLTGPDQSFPQFVGYLIEGNKLIIIRDKKFGDKPKRRAEFLILSVSGQELHLQALNWPAVYITDAVRSPKKKIDEDAYMNMEDIDITDSDLQSIELKLRRL
ncbi:MAG: hypothetical protein RLZZ77_2505 [Bacteroidota bacterium]|jgi:hypothetical protein